MWLCRRHEPSNQIARWLELLSEFKYTTEHRKGEKHGNADGLSRRACTDCKQCERIERRDGGPSHLELALEESQELTLQSAGASSEVDLQSADASLASGIDLQSADDPPTSAQLRKELGPDMLQEGMARTVQSTTPAELQRLQSEGEHPVAMMYRALVPDEPLTES